MKKFLAIFFIQYLSLTAFAQHGLEMQVSVFQEKPLVDFLIEIENQRELKFFFLEEWLQPYSVSPSFNGSTLQHTLETILTESGISFIEMFDYAVIFSKDATPLIAYRSLIGNAVAEKKAIERLRLGEKKPVRLNETVSFSGIVNSELSGMPLSEVLIFVDDKHAAATAESGRFELTMNPGSHLISFRLSGFKEKVIDLAIYENGNSTVVLEENPTVLREIEISDQAIVNRSLGHSNLKMTDIKRTPTFLGEADIIKTIQSQPGVTTVGEVASGFNVRGGGVDQNLVLYDGVPVLNTSHALGFFTAFNSDVVDNVSFYRGGIPAQYGGRVSSVLEITSREGDPFQWKGGGGIGIISSNLTIGGPIKKDTTTFIASLRTSYSNWMLKAIRSNYTNTRRSSVSFYDGSLKLAHAFNKKSKLTFSGYTSYDDFSLTNDTLYSTRNIAASVRFDQVVSQDLFASFSLAYGKYEYRVREEDPANAFVIGYDISHPSLKADFHYDGNHNISFGVHNTFYVFSPGFIEPRSGQSDAAYIEIPREQAIESGIYISDDFQWRERFHMEAGVRLSVFNKLGPGTVFHYAAGSPREVRNTVDSTTYEGPKIMYTYVGPEPRLSVQYTFNTNASVKVGYNRIHQYLHLVTNTAAITPLDIWQSTNDYFEPQIADQISAGYYRSLQGNTYEAFAEVFYKRIQNILDFKDGSQLILNRQIETALLSGFGLAYGAELSVTKIKGRLTGAVNYTFSRSFRKTIGERVADRLNNGNFYPANYDQPNIVNASWRYGLSRRIFFSGNFTYHTGRPVSLPESAYSIDGIPVQNFSERNKYRIPDYHRMDIALIVEGNHKLKKFWDGTWVLSFYNVYARKNAYSVFFQDDGGGKLIPYKLAVIGTVIPSLSYSFKI